MYIILPMIFLFVTLLWHLLIVTQSECWTIFKIVMKRACVCVDVKVMIQKTDVLRILLLKNFTWILLFSKKTKNQKTLFKYFLMKNCIWYDIYECMYMYILLLIFHHLPHYRLGLLHHPIAIFYVATKRTWHTTTYPDHSMILKDDSNPHELYNAIISRFFEHEKCMPM